MKNYYRLMLGKGSMFADECRSGGYVGVYFAVDQDLSNSFPDDWREFNAKFIPLFLEKLPEKSKIAAGLACGFVHTVCKGMSVGDVVLCPNRAGGYHVGEVSGAYTYHQGTNLPHRRAVRWYDLVIDRSAMSEPLQNSAGSIGTVSNISRYAEEIEQLIKGGKLGPGSMIAEGVEDPAMFALEKHLEDFLVQNWRSTELGARYDIYEEDGELVGQQYPSDTGPIDILAISKDRKELLVIELKKGKASDVVLGQIQRYMGYVMEMLTEPNQKVKGIIIALEDDVRIQRALRVTQNIEFYRYQISFKLLRA